MRETDLRTIIEVLKHSQFLSEGVEIHFFRTNISLVQFPPLKTNKSRFPTPGQSNKGTSLSPHQPLSLPSASNTNTPNSSIYSRNPQRKEMARARAAHTRCRRRNQNRPRASTTLNPHSTQHLRPIQPEPTTAGPTGTPGKRSARRDRGPRGRNLLLRRAGGRRLGGGYAA